jgi:hypothetical protein
MSKASKYTPTTNFENQQDSQGAVQGVSMDVEFIDLKNTINDNANKQDEIRRSDSTADDPRLNNQIVWPETLAPATLNLITLAANTSYTVRGVWASNASYNVYDVVSVSRSIPGYGSTVTSEFKDAGGSELATVLQPASISSGALSAEEYEDASGKTVSYTTSPAPATEGTGIFLCLTAHTSSTSFDDDLAAGYWFQIGGALNTGFTFPVPVDEGGTGAETASNARSNLGLEIGSDVQAWGLNLDLFSGLTGTTDKLPYFTSNASMTLTDLTALGRSLLSNANASGMRSVLGLIIGADVEAYDPDILKADTDDTLDNLISETYQTHTGTSLSGFTATNNKIEWTLTATSTFDELTFTDPTSLVFYITPDGNNLTFAEEYTQYGEEYDSAASEVRVTVDINGSNKRVTVANALA